MNETLLLPTLPLCILMGIYILIKSRNTNISETRIFAGMVGGYMFIEGFRRLLTLAGLPEEYSALLYLFGGATLIMWAGGRP